MLQFYLSKDFSKDMSMHLSEGAEPIVDQHARAMQWYAHRITVKRRKCVIVMELQSRYAMVFCGLTKRDFENFPELFRKRFLCEVASICQFGDDAQSKLTPLVEAQSDQQIFQTGFNRSVQAHINDVAWHLDNWAHEHDRLPADDSECFDIGVFVNQLLRKCSGDKDYFEPLERYRRFWTSLSGLLKLTEGRRSQLAQRAVPDNILPFNRGNSEDVR